MVFTKYKSIMLSGMLALSLILKLNLNLTLSLIPTLRLILIPTLYIKDKLDNKYHKCFKIHVYPPYKTKIYFF